MGKTPDAVPIAGDETTTLLAVLDRNRATFRWKCAGLGGEQMRATTAASTMTLAGLVKHLALVEEYYFSERSAGRPMLAPFDAIDFDADPDWEWRTTLDDAPEELLALFDTCVERSRATTDELLGEARDLGVATAYVAQDGTAVNLRRVIADLIEEYARHTGHADLLRESIDGLVGENEFD